MISIAAEVAAGDIVAIPLATRSCAAHPCRARPGGALPPRGQFVGTLDGWSPTGDFSRGNRLDLNSVEVLACPMLDIAKIPCSRPHAVLPDLRRRDVGTIGQPVAVGDSSAKSDVDCTSPGTTLGLHDGFLAMRCFVSVEGRQPSCIRAWNAETRPNGVQRTAGRTAARGVDEAGTGIERPGVTRERLYRELPTGDMHGHRGCVGAGHRDVRDAGVEATAGRLGERGDARGGIRFPLISHYSRSA